MNTPLKIIIKFNDKIAFVKIGIIRLNNIFYQIIQYF